MLKNLYWFVYWYSFSIFCLFTFRTFVFISKKLKNPIQSTAWKSKTNHLIWSVIYFQKELLHSNEFFQVLTFNWYGKKSWRIQENPRPVRQIFDFNRDNVIWTYQPRESISSQTQMDFIFYHFLKNEWLDTCWFLATLTDVEYR